MESKIKIRLCGVEQVSKFISVARRFVSSSVNIISGNKVLLNAKSIMGVFNFDYLHNDVYVEIDSNNADEIKKFNLMMEEFR